MLRPPPRFRRISLFSQRIHIPLQPCIRMASTTTPPTAASAHNPSRTSASSAPPRVDPSPVTATRATKPSKPPQKPKQPRLTHFICIPVHDAPDLEPNLAAFRPRLEALGLHQNCIRPAICLHLTIGVMSLSGEEELRAAGEVLAGIKLRELLGGDAAHQEPIRLALKGVAAFPRPSNARVLYAIPQEETGRLQRLAEAVRDVFVEKGLVKIEKGREELKLHATVANTIYAKGGDRGGRGRGKWGKKKEGQDMQKGDAAGVGSKRTEGERSGEGIPEETAEDVEEAGGVKLVEEAYVGVKDDAAKEELTSNTAGPANADQEEPKNQKEKGKWKGKKHNRSRPATFNASELVEDTKEYLFAESVEVTGVAICKMGAEEKDGVKGGGGYPPVVWKGWNDEVVFKLKDGMAESKSVVDEDAQAQKEEMTDSKAANREQ